MTRRIIRVPLFAMLLIMAMLFGSAYGANYSNGVLTDNNNGFKISVPGSWNRQVMSNADSNTHLFVTQDQRIAIGVSTFPGAGSWTEQQLLDRFRQSAFANARQFVEQPAQNNGINGILRAYRENDPNGTVIISAFGVVRNGKGYVVWTMIQEYQYNNLYPQADAVTNTFTIIGTAYKSRPAPSHGSLEGDGNPAPGFHAPRQQVQQQAAGKFVRFRDPEAGLQFDLPSGWSESHPEPHILSLRGKGDKQLMTVNYQVLSRQNPKYVNLHTAIKDVHAQLPGLGQYQVVNEFDTNIQGMPAKILDVFVNPGDQQYAVRYIEIERPNYMALFSLISPKNQHGTFAPIAKRVQSTIAPWAH